jgi:hypothetical protein
MLATQSLFHPGYPTLPGWLPDETFYSLVSRHHRITRNPVARSTSEQLFGRAQSGYQHDFPSSLDAFVERTMGMRGSTREIIREHTIAPYFFPFRGEHDAEDANTAMAGPGIFGLKSRLGILAGRFRANHPLKACAICRREDLDRDHVAYWHLTHQYPGVWICRKHGELLSQSTLKATGVARFQWILPDEAEFSPDTPRISDVASPETFRLALTTLADSAVSLARLPDSFYFDPSRLLRTHHRALDHLGFKTRSGNLRLGAMCRPFLDTVHPLRAIHELRELPANDAEVVSQIGRLLRAPRSGTHPIRHLVFIQWLFGDWETFWRAYQSGPVNAPDVAQGYSTQNARDAKTTDKRISSFLALLKDGQYTVTGAAHRIGIDPKTAMAWAARAGISTPRRAKSLSADIRKRLIHDLRQGRGKQAVATKYDVSIETITTTLRTEVGLHQTWSQARLERRREIARKRWSRIAQRHGATGVKAMRLLAPDIYAWLYRNDRAWLRACNLQFAVEVKRSNNASVNWDARDAALSAQVREVALKISSESGSSSIPLWRLYQAISDLRPLLQSLERLPLTRRAIEMATGRRQRKRNAELFPANSLR